MPSITIRNLEPELKARLRLRAARHGRSMEAEARAILHVALNHNRYPTGNLAEAIHAKFAPLGFEQPSIPREPMRKPPRFGL